MHRLAALENLGCFFGRAAVMDRPSAPGVKLTPTQFRMLQRIPDEGLPLSALQQRHGYGIAAQIRTLRILSQWNLVIETQRERGDVRFETTDAGRQLARSNDAR
jgi:hypothetical protein